MKDYMTNPKIYDLIKKLDPETYFEYEELESLSLPEIIGMVWRDYRDDNRNDAEFIEKVLELIIKG